MNRILTGSLNWILGCTRLELLPTRVRSGVAAGARWTLYPCSAYWRGGQEPALHDALLSLGDIRGWSCWDLGAHFGIYSVGLARRVGDTGEVAAFEPNPVSYARLERHRQMNHLHWLKTFPAAVSDRHGRGELYTYGNLQSTTTHLAYENETSGPDTHPLAVSMVVLDELVAAGRLRLPDLVKVDVEGHAHHALSGARKALTCKRPILIVGTHSAAELSGTLEILAPLDYEHVVIGATAGESDSLIGRDLLFRPRLR